MPWPAMRRWSSPSGTPDRSPGTWRRFSPTASRAWETKGMPAGSGRSSRKPRQHDEHVAQVLADFTRGPAGAGAARPARNAWTRGRGTRPGGGTWTCWWTLALPTACFTTGFWSATPHRSDGNGRLVTRRRTHRGLSLRKRQRRWRGFASFLRCRRCRSRRGLVSVERERGGRSEPSLASPAPSTSAAQQHQKL